MFAIQNSEGKFCSGPLEYDWWQCMFFNVWNTFEEANKIAHYISERFGYEGPTALKVVQFNGEVVATTEVKVEVVSLEGVSNVH